jgi:flagellar P-ring protein FlgI
MITSILLALFQAPVSGTPAVNPSIPVVIPITGGVEAPTQPTGKSSSTYSVLPRIPSTPNLKVETGLSVHIRDIMRVRGQELNTITGVGLVEGLAGTGDSGGLVRRLKANYLREMDINVLENEIQLGNIAVVTLSAVLPANVKAGSQIDVTAACMGDATSLTGGVLLFSYLRGPDGTLYGTAGGPLSTGAISASAEGVSATTSHPTVGMVIGGCKVEEEVKSEIVSEHGFIYLDAPPRNGSFATAVKVTNAVNGIYPGAAVAIDGLTVRVTVPEGVLQDQHVAFLASILEREIIAESFARIVINERTGVIVFGAGVRIGPGAVTKGNLTVTIAESPEASQPGPLSGGSTEVVPRTQLVVEEENRPISIIKGAANLNEVVEVLNVLGATARDMIQILQSMESAGMLYAQIQTK